MRSISTEFLRSLLRERCLPKNTRFSDRRRDVWVIARANLSLTPPFLVVYNRMDNDELFLRDVCTHVSFVMVQRTG